MDFKEKPMTDSEYRKRKIIALAITVFFTSGILSFLEMRGIEKPVLALAEDKKETVYPTLYSDKNITPNAIISDPRFRNLFSIRKSDLLANTVSSVSRSRGSVSSNERESGTWLWTPLLQITPKYRKEIILGAKKNGVKNIYLSIDSYLDIYVIEDNEEKEKEKEKFDKALREFIKEANENGISVDAEAGWRNWAEIGNSYKAFAVLEYTINFNKNYEEKLRGFQYDIEPYLLESYKRNKAKVLSNFINLVDETVARLDGSDLEFSVVIPEFYNGENDETPQFFYAGKMAYAFDHLLKVLGRRDGSKIIVMSYRNFARGEDGSIEISNEEVEKANISNTKVIIAQETGDFEPPTITFYNTSKKYYEKQTGLLISTFDRERGFGGIATHYVNSFLELK